MWLFQLAKYFPDLDMQPEEKHFLLTFPLLLSS